MKTSLITQVIQRVGFLCSAGAMLIAAAGCASPQDDVASTPDESADNDFTLRNRIPKIGLAIAPDLLAGGTVVAIEYQAKCEDPNYDTTKLEKKTLKAASSSDFDKYVSPVADAGDKGFMYEGSSVMSDANLVHFCLFDKSGKKVALRYNKSGCVELNGKKALDAIRACGYGEPGSEEQLAQYTQMSNPGIKLRVEGMP